MRGLILRGFSHSRHPANGYILGLYIVGLERTAGKVSFAILTALCLVAGYSFIGAKWLLMKTEGVLQCRAVAWARGILLVSGIGMVAVRLCRSGSGTSG
jgi:cytochrome d ubiquinol oxidase subunit II